MRKSSVVCWLLVILMVALTGAPSGFAEENAAAGKRVAGYYVCFETEEGRIRTELRRGILSLCDGFITKIEEYAENEPETVYLDPSCVILPGLLDLHSHIDFNSIQLWISKEAGSLWDNRFEWRASANYREEVKNKYAILSSHWDEDLYPGDTPVCKGDILQYFAELQAIAGGTTVIEGISNAGPEYDAADSHEKVRMIRSTALAADLERDGGLPVSSVIQLYVPDVQMTAEEQQTYLPPIDTSGWKTKLATDYNTDRTWLAELLEGIAEKTGSGWLIHMAEGRAGYLAATADAYSRLEFDTFRQDITSGVEQGLFTAEDVRDAHIGLIHACAVNLQNEEDRAFLTEYGIGLIWSPVSNLMLYADTPDFFRYMDSQEPRIAIGSDWSPSGSKNVWEESKFAYDLIGILNQETDTTRENLLKACTVIPAEMLGEDRQGNIREGAFADLFILRGKEDIDGSLDAALNTFMTGSAKDVEAVLIRGEAAYGERDFLARLTGDETLAGYGQYAKEDGDSKYFRVPELFGNRSLEDLYQEYEAMLADAEVEISRVRESEDLLYNTAIDDLKQTLQQQD